MTSARSAAGHDRDFVMQYSPRSVLLPYGGAVLAVIAAVVARLVLDPWFGDRFPFATLFLAVMIVAGHWGRGPALLATVFGGLLATCFLLPSRQAFLIDGVNVQYGLALYLTLGIGIALLSGVLHEARHRAELISEQAVRQHEQLRITLSSIGDGVLVTDAEGRVTSMNPIAETLTGWKTEEAVGQPLPSIFHIVDETTRQEVDNPALQALREGVIVGLGNHAVLIARDGTERAIDDSASPILDSSGQVLGSVLIFRDVSERKKIEAEALQAGERARTILESITDAFCSLDREWRFVYVNSQAESLLGRKAADLLGKNHWEEYPATLGSELELQYRRAINENVPVRFLNYYEPRDRWYDLQAYPSPSGLSVYFRDVTAQHRHEEALRESEERFRHLAAAMPQILWIGGPDGSVEFFNERWFEYTGLSRDQSYHADGWRETVHPDDIDRILETAARQKSLGLPFEAEYRLKRRDGVYRWHLGRMVDILDEQGRVLQSFGSATDIDDRKRSENDAVFLAESSAILAAIVDENSTLAKVAHLAVPSFADWCSVDMAGEDGQILRLAVAHVDPAKVALGHEYHRRYPPNPEAPKGVPQVIKTGVSALVPLITDEMIVASARDEGQLQILRELGIKSYICVPLRGRTGVLGAISFVAAESGRIYDESDLRLAEDLAARAAIALDNARLFREVQESEARFRQLADAMPQIVWTSQPDGTVDYFNKRWYEFTGLSEFPDAAANGEESWVPILHPDDVEPSLEQWYGAVRSNQPYEYEFRMLDHRSGDYRWHLGRALPVNDDSGRVAKWYGTATDIHDRRQAEEALRVARDEAEEANRAKTQFLAVLSHELRTPLNPILLASSSMLDRPCDPEEIRPTLEMIRQNVNLQARLIDDLLDVMRIVRGKMPLHWEVADGHDLIEQAVRICKSDLQGHELRLTFEPGADQSHVNADAARLQQVFWNLIKNAVKFTPEGGSIVVRTRNESVEDGDLLIVEVEDSGIGIEPEILPRIFEPFQQGETTMTRKFGGLGLGLAICKSVVEAHGGTISVESAGPGRGSTFRIALNILADPVRPITHDHVGGSSEDRPLSVRTLRILVVEDEPATLRLMARLLQGLGHEVSTASSIAAAIEAIESLEFDLMISDIGLPDGTGLELIHQIVASRGPIPAIALTGYGMEDDIRRSREAGFTAHMTKPIDFTKLEVIIRKVVAIPVDGEAVGPDHDPYQHSHVGRNGGGPASAG